MGEENSGFCKDVTKGRRVPPPVPQDQIAPEPKLPKEDVPEADPDNLPPPLHKIRPRKKKPKRNPEGIEPSVIRYDDKGPEEQQSLDPPRSDLETEEPVYTAPKPAPRRSEPVETQDDKAEQAMEAREWGKESPELDDD